MDADVERMLSICEALEKAMVIADDPILVEQINIAFHRADTLCQKAMKLSLARKEGF